MKGNLVYGQSGGPSSVINASAYGVIHEALERSDKIDKVYIMKHGIDGVINDNLIDAEAILHQIDLLPKTPASAFGSVRYKMPKEDAEVYGKIFDTFEKYNIRYFVYNGGNDSMDTCVKLEKYAKKIDYKLRVIGVPKTVDNDLPHTDHTPGFGSAAKYIINTIMQIKLDSTVYPKGKITIVEIMGRHAGWLTAASAVASLNDLGPDLIYLPEHNVDVNDIAKDVQKIYSKQQNCLIAVSEGIKDKEGNFIGMSNSFKDAFGHNQLGGVGIKLGEMIQEKTGISYRAIELSSTQRSASFIQSETDVIEAIQVGKHAVKSILEGESGKMVVINRVSDDPYKVEYGVHNVSDIANEEKVIPESMFTNGVLNQKFFNYILPLIEGQAETQYEKGMQKLFKL